MSKILFIAKQCLKRDNSNIYPDDCDREDSSSNSGCQPNNPTYYYTYDENRNGKPDYDDFYSN